MSWDTFFRVTSKKPPSPLLIDALSHIKQHEWALDLGAGAMNDTRFLSQSGFKVIAVDSNKDAQEYIKNIPNAEFNASTFDAFGFPTEKFDIVNAQYALPFNSPATFNEMFTKLIQSLKHGGTFVGQFFGNEDKWHDDPTMTFHTKKQVEDLLTPLSVLYFREEKGQGETAVGKGKFWHVFHIIAQKK